jgi:hypothetical protein
MGTTESTTPVAADSAEKPLLTVSVRTAVELDDRAVLRTIQELFAVDQTMLNSTGIGIRVTNNYVRAKAEHNVLGANGQLDYYDQPEVQSNLEFMDKSVATFQEIFKRPPAEWALLAPEVIAEPITKGSGSSAKKN